MIVDDDDNLSMVEQKESSRIPGRNDEVCKSSGGQR